MSQEGEHQNDTSQQNAPLVSNEQAPDASPQTDSSNQQQQVTIATNEVVENATTPMTNNIENSNNNSTEQADPLQVTTPTTTTTPDQQQPQAEATTTIDDTPPSSIDMVVPEIGIQPVDDDDDISKPIITTANDTQQQQQQQVVEEKEAPMPQEPSLYTFKSDATWFKLKDSKITLPREKSQVSQLHNKTTAEQITQLEPFAQECLHLFSGEWTVLKPNETYAKRKIVEDDAVCWKFLFR